MYLVKIPWWIKKLYPGALTWKIDTEKKEIFLTFDDGPHPDITPFVLSCLKGYNAKATFFCIGKNVQQYPEVYKHIIKDGHSVGNHTHHHLNGWKTGKKQYIEDVLVAKKHISSTLFRPPYGRISKPQVKYLSMDFKIIMWDVLSGDFDNSISPERCYSNVTSNAVPGSLVVFHDSEKAFPRLKYALPRALEFFATNGYDMRNISF